MLKNTLLKVEEFALRRTQFASKMPQNSVAFIKSGEEVTRSNDTEYPFCPNKNFYYLTGFHEPDSLVMLIKYDDAGVTKTKSILFCREKNPQMEVWHGRRVGPEAAKSDYGFDDCFSNDVIEEEVVVYEELALSPNGNAIETGNDVEFPTKHTDEETANEVVEEDNSFATLQRSESYS